MNLAILTFRMQYCLTTRGAHSFFTKFFLSCLGETEKAKYLQGNEDVFTAYEAVAAASDYQCYSQQHLIKIQPASFPLDVLKVDKNSPKGM